MQAMILAAGLGTRLRPYTLIKPKPLFPLLNTPLLDLHIDRLTYFGANTISVNSFYLQHQIRDTIANRKEVILHEEEKILGTGGGLRNALPCFDDSPILVTNGDIYHTIDLRQLYRHHLNSPHKVTLAVHDYPRFNTLQVEGGCVKGFSPEKSGQPLAFTGVHVIDVEVLENIPASRDMCIIEHYRNFIKSGETIGIYRVDHCFWSDMGTVKDYLDLHGKILCQDVPFWNNRRGEDHTSAPISSQAQVGKNFTVHDWAAIGNARIGSNVTITRSVVWDGAEIATGSTISDTIVTP